MDISIKFGHHFPTQKIFKTNADLIRWLDREHKEWTTLGPTNPQVKNVCDALTAIKSKFEKAPDIRADEDYKKLNNYLRNSNINQLYQRVILETASADFKFLKKSQKEHPDSFAALHGYFNTKSIASPTSPAALIAMRLLGNYLLPKDKASLAPNRAAFKTLEDDYKQRLLALDTKLSQAETKTQNWIQKEQDSMDAALEEMAETTERRVTASLGVSRMLYEDLENRSNKAIEQINATDKLYKTDLSLKPASEYWTKKAKIHDQKAKSLLKGLIVGGIIFTLLIIGVLAALIWTKPDLGKIGETTTLLIVAATITLSTLLFWAARIATRIYLGNVHLANDARERAILIQTYLALNTEGKATDADRALVLATVFRPSTDGVVRDDGAPGFTPAAILSGRGTG